MSNSHFEGFQDIWPPKSGQVSTTSQTLFTPSTIFWILTLPSTAAYGHRSRYKRRLASCPQFSVLLLGDNIQDVKYNNIDMPRTHYCVQTGLTTAPILFPRYNDTNTSSPLYTSTYPLQHSFTQIATSRIQHYWYNVHSSRRAVLNVFSYTIQGRANNTLDHRPHLSQICATTYDSDLKRAKISLKNMVS